jgi:hypothetical protein
VENTHTNETTAITVKGKTDELADLFNPHANERRLKKWWPEDLIN